MTISKLIDSLFLARESEALTLQEAEAIAAKLRAAEELADRTEMLAQGIGGQSRLNFEQALRKYQKAGEINFKAGAAPHDFSKTYKGETK